jgi:hypothetical protein
VEYAIGRCWKYGTGRKQSDGISGRPANHQKAGRAARRYGWDCRLGDSIAVQILKDRGSGNRVGIIYVRDRDRVERQVECGSGLDVAPGRRGSDCGSRKFQMGEMAARTPIYPGIRTRERRASTRRRAEEVGPLLEEQSDSHLSRCARARAPEVSGCASFVPVVETADLRDSYDSSKLWRLHSPRFRRVLTQ